MQTHMLEPFPPNENPFLHDAVHMGTRLGKNVVVMHSNHSYEEAKYLIIVNVTTGERMKVML